MTTTKRTAGPVAQISLDADKTVFNLKGKDLSYITVRLQDKDGNFCPKANNWMSFSVKGPGRIIATGNGDPLSHESFQSRSVRSFNGMALAIVAPTGEEGEITVTARPVLRTWGKPVEVTISAK